MVLTFRCFEIVEAVMRGGTTSRAANALGISQPGLTKALSNLETEIGAKLFDRTPIGMVPTEFSRVMMENWGKISRDILELQREINQIRQMDDGVLRIATGYLAATSSEMALGTMIQKFPGLRFEARQLIWSEMAAAVRRGEVDIGVCDPTDAETDPALNVEILVDRPANFICRRHHPLLALKAPTLEDILSYPFALGVIPSRMAAHFPTNFEDFGLRRVSQGHLIPQIGVQSISAIRNVVLGSDAVSIMPAGHVFDEFHSGQFAPIASFTPPWLKIRLGFITRTNALHTPAMAAFLNEVRQIELERSQVPKPDPTKTLQ